MFFLHIYSFLFCGRFQTPSMLVFIVLYFLCVGLHACLSCLPCLHPHGPTNARVAAIEISLYVSRPMHFLAYE